MLIKSIFRPAIFILFCVTQIVASAQVGDTTVVQTFTWEAQNNPNTAYDSPGRRWFQFPASNNGVEYQKILMYYNLKCFSDGTAGNLGFPCGEWDYLTYTYLYDHTGVMDSTLGSHPQYLLNNADFQNANLTSQQVQNVYQVEQSVLVIDEVLNEDTVLIGGEAVSLISPFADGSAKYSLFLYTAEELSQAGFSQGVNLGRIAMMFDQQYATDNLKIDVALTGDLAITGIYSSLPFVNVYNASVNITGNDWHEFNLINNFSWDGSSSVLLRITHTGDLNTPSIAFCEAYDGEINQALSIHGTDKYLKMDWQDEVKVPKEVFENVSDQISISFWQYGDPDVQPQDGTIFEGVNSSNQRVLNVHLPWSNSNVYWDAGNDGGYDRINKLAVAANFEGRWNHWCFTKNATTGSMKIFLNGVQWHVGSNLDNLMLDIQRFSIGGATSWSNFYNGSIDEFAVFNVALDAATIQEWMNKDLDASHPFWSNLQVYYQFNESDGEMVLDASGNDRNAWIHGNAARVAYKGNELWRNASYGNQKPILKVFFGDYVLHQEIEVVEVIENVPPVSIVEYTIENYLPVVLSVEYAWEEQSQFTYDPDGDVIDEVLIPAEYTITNSEMEYWQAPFEIIDRYELNRFITMYGINLNLGTDGWTWVVDMTDFEPLLRDSVELEAGNWQELLDMKFLFIEGPAPREVLRVERMWDTNQSLSNFNNAVTEVNVNKQPGEAGWKLLTTNTGHQFDNPPNCAEFCSNIQSVSVNNQIQWAWDIMQECATNPLYPQGGTWIFDRAGWCPGMNSTTKEFELTPFVQGLDSFDVEYDIEYNDYGNYVFFGTLIGYGPINQQYDPEIQMITAPSDWKIHSRWNPICDNPKFILRNRGALPLTDLNIYFGVVGGATEAFHWTGNLAFMESEEIELTYNDAIMWEGGSDETLTFFVTLGLSQDGVDENESNNHAESTFHRPPVYQYTDLDDNRLIIQLKTNDAFTETSYTLYNRWGGVIFQRNDFDAANTTYRDTIQLNAGCYLFHLKDTDDDGLSFFANDDGSGSCKFDRVQGVDFENFERDFGREILHHFYWNTNLVSVEEDYKPNLVVRIFPNPAGNSAKLDVGGFDRMIDVTVFDSRGVIVKTERINRKNNFEIVQLNLSDIRAGLYTVRVSDEKHIKAVKLIKE